MTLPHRLFLLSHNAEKSGLDANSGAVRGVLLRAAALAELRLAGLLRDRDGKAERTGQSPRGQLEPFVAEVLDDVEPDRPRGWFGVIDQNWPQAEGTVRDQLVAEGAVTAERHRVWLVIPSYRIRVLDPGAARASRDRVRAPVVEGVDPASVPIEDAVLAALAIEGHVSTAFWRRELRANPSAAPELKARVENELPGLLTALSWAIAARRTTAPA